MPIIINGNDQIVYTPPRSKQLTEETFSFSDEDFSIHDKDNVLKQIDWDIIPLDDQPGVLTLAAEIAGDTTLNITSVLSSVPFTTERFTLSALNISNKSVTLAHTPATPNTILVNPIGGIPQNYAVDFTVSGATLSWNGLFLDGVLEENDVLLISYAY